MEKLRIALAVRKDIVEQELSATDWQWNSPAGGFNLWVKLPETVEIERLLSTCIKQSITFVPGAICDPLKEYKSWIRLSYSYLNEQLLREGIQKLVELADGV